MSFDDSWVDEVRRGLWVPALKQMHSNLTSQAAILNLNGFPNDILINLDPIFCVILSPIYAHFIYPSIHCLPGNLPKGVVYGERTSGQRVRP